MCPQVYRRRRIENREVGKGGARRAEDRCPGGGQRASLLSSPPSYGGGPPGRCQEAAVSQDTCALTTFQPAGVRIHVWL